MAVISNNAIKVDYVVGGLDQLQKAAESFDKISAEEKQALAELRKFNTQVKQTGTDTVKATGYINQGFSGMSGSLKSLGPLLATTFSVGALTAFAKQALNTTKEFEQLKNTIDFVSGSAKEGAKTFAFLTSLSQRLGQDLLSLSKAYSNFAYSSQLAGINQKETNRIFESAVLASTALGKSSLDTQGVLLAFSQIMSKGTVQAEELRGQIGERIPGAFNLAAKAMGVTTRELNKMLEQGQVISADFMPKFATELEKAFGEAALSKTNTLTASVNRLGTAWDTLVNSIGESKVGELAGREIRIWTGYLKTLRDALTSDEKLNQERYLQNLENIRTNAKTEVKITQEKWSKINGVNMTQRAVAQGLLNKDKDAYEKLLNRVKFFNLEIDKRTLEYVEARRQVLKDIINDAAKLDKIAEKTPEQLKKEYQARVKLLEIEKQVRELRIKLATEAGGERDLLLIRNAEKFGKMRLAIDREFGKQGVEDAINNAKTQGLINRTLHDDAVNNIKDRAAEGAKATDSALDSIRKQMEENNKFDAERGRAQEKSLSDKEKNDQDNIELERKKQDEILKIDKNSKDEKARLEKELTELTIQEWEARAQVASSVANAAQNLYEANVQNELATLDRRYQEELRLADGNQQKVNELNEKRRAKEKEIRTKEFRSQQAFAIAQVIFKTTPYIAEYLASGILAPLAASALITQGIEIAAIAATPVPEFKEGTKGVPFKGGLALVGDGGESELVKTPSGKVFWTPATDTLMNLPKGTEVFTQSQVEERFPASQISATAKPRFIDPMLTKLDSIERTLKGLPITQLSMDERGFTKSIIGKNHREISRNNKFPSRR